MPASGADPNPTRSHKMVHPKRQHLRFLRLLEMKPLRTALAVAVSLGLVLTGLYMKVLTEYLGDPLSPADSKALQVLQKAFGQCVGANGWGLEASRLDGCGVRFAYPPGTKPMWNDTKTGHLEGLAYDFDLCEVLSVWEQIRNTSTILTREYIEGIPDGWHKYAWQRINKGDQLNNCRNVSLCMEKLALVLPDVSPFHPRQYGRCAVVGNSGDLLKTQFGEEIDTYDAVIRGNGAPTQGFFQHVGRKSTFRLLNRGSAKALDKVAALDATGQEILIVKTTIHDVMSKMIREVPITNPVYLLLGMHMSAAAKGTGLKALEFALSVCETVDIYGFTVDPGYMEWTRYFSESRGGHAPLQGRAYYQMMECLGLITIHSPMRDQLGHTVAKVPPKDILDHARKAAEKARNKLAGGRSDPLAACSLWTRRASKTHLSKLPVTHQTEGSVSMYPLPQSTANEMLCVPR